MFSRSARRTTGRAPVALAAAVLVGMIVSALPATGKATGLPAQVVDYEPPVRKTSFKVTSFGKSPSPRDDRVRRAPFRVVERTGNCCENYITIDSTGRLFDLGGSYINFTDDAGKTWKSVRPINPLVNGEGTIAVAPNGDIVGVEWDPYSGDHLLSYKYDAKTKEWQYLEAPLHTPFYDRPWLTVVPGPFDIDGQKVPYVVFVDGYPHRGPLLYSTDGLTYIQTSNPFIDQHFTETAHKLNTKGSRELDWVLPNSESPISALGGGSALAAPGPFARSWSVLDPKTQTWQALELDVGELDGRYLVDSRGRLHNLVVSGRSFVYKISADEGRTWKETRGELPAGNVTEFDFRPNAKLGVSAVALHVDSGDADSDVVFKLDVSTNKPRITHLYEVGKGDTDSTAGVGQMIRLDFQTIAFFPNGKLAVSFLDSTTGPVYHLAEPAMERIGPALAIEL